jgi:hypothetical protein
MAWNTQVDCVQERQQHIAGLRLVGFSHSDQIKSKKLAATLSPRPRLRNGTSAVTPALREERQAALSRVSEPPGF